jgi:hypothetical protein
MGGQITSKNIGGLTYEITLTLYRDTLGIPMSATQIIAYTDSTGNYVNTFPSHTINYDSSLTTNIGNGVERYVFKDTVTFPYIGKFRAEMENCCRNAAILNLPNPSSNSLWLDVDITADPSNSSPVFLNEPITVAQLNQPFSYNPLPFDADGDSLSWQLDVPMDYFTNTVGLPIPGYVLPPSDTLAPFSIDPLTGEITFLPIVAGNFQVSVKAIEWRNGIQIGYIRRDMQLLVVPSSNMPVNVQVGNYVQRNTTNPIYVNVGETLTFNLDAFNIDNGPVSVTTGGSALLNTSATSYLAMISNNEMMATINWTPSLNEVNDAPYYLSFRIGDYSAPYTFYNDYTFRVIVTNNTTGLNEIGNNNKEGKLIRTIDVMGREIDTNSKGLVIKQYDNGTSKKIFVQE